MAYTNAHLPIQAFISNYGFTDRNWNVIDFVLSTSRANTNIQMQPPMFLNAPGKKRTVRFNYFPMVCDVEGDCSAGLCDDGTAIEPVQRDFDINECTATAKYKVNFEDIRKTDNGNWDFSGVALETIAHVLPQARKLLAIDWLTKLFTMKGVHPDGNPAKRVSVTNPATGVVNPIGRFQIETEYDDAGFERPYILGDKEVKYWMEMVNIGGVNAQGQLINQVDTANTWYDQNLLQNIGGDLANGGWILTIAPQMFKYVSYINNAGIFRTDLSDITDMDKLLRGSYGEGFILSTVTDPVTGIIWDLYINFTKCDATTGLPAWTIQLKHQWDMFVLPDITCSAEGVNGIMAWRTCPLVIAPCPEGDSPSPAVAESIYSWNPGFSYPYTVFKGELGGVTVSSEEGTILANDTDTANYLSDLMGEPGMFTLSGGNIQYSGYTALTGELNDGDVTVTFA